MSGFIARIALLSIVFAISAPSEAQLVENRDYIELSPPQPTSDPDRIVVTEFFSYQCPHCYAFSEPLEAWVKTLPKDVVFERLAVSLGYRAWVPIARAFYALQTMGQLDALDAAIFRAIHVQGLRLADETSITNWVAAQGVDRAEFTATYQSFAVSVFLQHGEDSSRALGVPSIPTLVIDSRFIVPIQDNGTFDAQLDGAKRLIAKAREARR